MQERFSLPGTQVLFNTPLGLIEASQGILESELSDALGDGEGKSGVLSAHFEVARIAGLKHPALNLYVFDHRVDRSVAFTPPVPRRGSKPRPDGSVREIGSRAFKVLTFPKQEQ